VPPNEIFIERIIVHGDYILVLRQREGLQMQTDRASRHKYEILHSKRLAIGK